MSGAGRTPRGRVLVFQHLDCEHPGIFRDFLASDGIAIDTIARATIAALPAMANVAAQLYAGLRAQMTR